MRHARLIAIDLPLYVLFLSVLFCGSRQLDAADGNSDWPQYRYDAGRRAATPGSLPDTLHLQWVRTFPKPKPAWPGEPTQQVDMSYEPVVGGGLLFVPSNADDSVTAIDTTTGGIKWRFFTQGPVRYAPLFWNGKVFFGSDDGHLYCLQSTTGKLLWKFNGAPSQRKVVGHGRMISVWPISCGPVLVPSADGKGGMLYVTAGIWPFEGIFVYALDPNSGKQIWMNDSTSFVFNYVPHKAATFNGLSPQGYLAVGQDALYVPNGNLNPAVFDRHTGKLKHFPTLVHPMGKKWGMGGVHVAVTSEYLFNDAHIFSADTLKVLRSYAFPTHYRERIKKAPVSLNVPIPLPVLSDDTLYCGTGTFDIATEVALGYKHEKSDYNTWLSASAKNAQSIWLKAGSRLVGSSGKTVQTFDAPAPGGPFKSLWTFPLKETPSSMIAANHRLFVTTVDGKMYCFGGAKAAPRELAFKRQPLEKSKPNTSWTTLAEKAISRTTTKKGFCLVPGSGSGSLINALLAQSLFHVVVVEKDPKKVLGLREEYSAAGLYGDRISVIQGDPMSIQWPPYAFSLIASEDMETAGIKEKSLFVKHLFRALRPYGGICCLSLPAASRSQFSDWVSKADCRNGHVDQDGELTILTRKGSLPGADQWQSMYGNAGNSQSNKESLVKSPLGVLWFGGRHNGDGGIVIGGGRMFLYAENQLSAVDVYTGCPLWNESVSGGPRLLLGENRLYLSASKGFEIRDAGTGKVIHQILRAKGVPRAWDAILVDDVLVTLTSGAVTAIDGLSGKVLWTFESADQSNMAIAGGGDKVFVLRTAKTKATPRKGHLKQAGHVVALDRKTGKELWKGQERDALFPQLFYDTETDVFLHMNRDTTQKYDRKKEMVTLFALRGQDGADLWQKQVGPVNRTRTTKSPAMTMERMDAMLHKGMFIVSPSPRRQASGAAYDLLTGKERAQTDPLTGQPFPWGFDHHSGGCGYMTASTHMISYRNGVGGYYDLLRTGSAALGGFRSNCTNNLLMADGVMSSPQGSRKCQCAYNIRTSISLVHEPTAETWTCNYFANRTVPKAIGDKPIKDLGINFGAPGDRRGDSGILWLEWPEVGGASRSIDMTVDPSKEGTTIDWFKAHHERQNTMKMMVYDGETFRHHSAWVKKGDLRWVAASGIEGVKTVKIKLNKEKPSPVSVRLVFLEPNKTAAPGNRVFDVSVQGKVVIQGLDIAKEAGGGMKSLVKEIKGVQAGADLTISFNPQKGKTLICGIEISN